MAEKIVLIKNGRVWNGEEAVKNDILIADGVISGMGENIQPCADCEVIDAEGATVLPGLIDMHVHLREPGYSYKETIADGTRAAAHGGFTTVCTMPNLNPVPDSKEHLHLQLDIINRDACIEVIPFASITESRMGNELVDYKALAPEVAGFSDDGSGVQDEKVMKTAMIEIAKTGKILSAHCEVNDLLKGGYIHEGEYARKHGHRGICSESEWHEVDRDIQLARQTGCRLHICHVSTRESVELVRRAKAEGLPVTCETGAHYLAYCEDNLQEDGRFKMNPPLRSRADKEALLRGIADGTIDCIASDHAPHTAEEKNRGLEKSAMGVTGIELSLPAVYTFAVVPGHISFKRMMKLMCENPAGLLGLEYSLREGNRANLTIVDFNKEFEVTPQMFLSKGKSTPFMGENLKGVVKMTLYKGKIVYDSRKY